VLDFDGDNRPDAVYNPDTDIIVMDTDGDHILDTRATVDMEHRQLTNREQLEGQVTIDGNMDVLHQENPNGMLADDTDLGPDFDNNADISDYDFT
jgi:hypothetical protein